MWHISGTSKAQVALAVPCELVVVRVSYLVLTTKVGQQFICATILGGRSQSCLTAFSV